MQVKVAKYWSLKGDSEKNDPMITTRIYWCVGFGNSAETLSQQVTIKNIFQAIFHIAKKPLPLFPLLGDEVASNQSIQSSTAKIDVDIPIEPTPLPPLIQELLVLSTTTKLDHPSRKLPIINVLYEDPPPRKQEPEVR